MQQITITLVSAEGAVTKKTMIKLPGQPVQVAVPAGTKVAVDVQGPVAGKTQPAQQGAKPDLKFKQVGQDLIIEGDGEKLVELTNFYATPNTTLGVVGWDYAEPVVDAAAATSIEGKAAADQAAVGVSGTGAASEASGFLPAMGWGPVALGGVAVAAIASGGGGGGGITGGGASGNILSGVVTGGPLINGHGLSLTLYKSDGTVLKSGIQLTAGPNGGTYSVDLGAYAGAVTARVVDASGDPDYQREDTGASKDLNANLLAMGKATGSPATLNVNAVTTLAALKALGVADGSTVATDGALGTAITNAGGATLDTDTTIADANTAVGKALGLTAIDTTTPSVTTNGTLDGSSASGKLGAMLAVLAGVDAINADDSQATINTLLTQIAQTGAAGTLSAAGQASLLAGAIKAGAATTGGVLVDVLSSMLSAVYSDATLTVGEITADNILLASELTGGNYTVTGTCASGTVPFTLSLNGVVASGPVTVTGTTWSYIMTGGEVTALGADGAKYISATVAGKTATRVFELNATNDAPSGVLFTPVLTTINESATATTLTKVATVRVADDGLGTADLNTLLGGADAASFTLVSTGVGTADLFLNAGLTLDREAKGSYTVTISATGDGAGVAGSGTFVLNVGNVNEAPTGANSAVTINEDASKTFAASDFGFVSGDASDAQFLKAVIITTLPAAGTLKLNGVAVTLNQSISKADIDEGNLVFAPALNANGNTYATIGFKVQDDGGIVNGGVDTSAAANTLTINVTAVNDEPVNTVPSAKTVNEDTDLAITGLSVVDVDADASSITVTLSVLHGTITVANNIAGGLAAGGIATNGTSSVVLTGTLAAINATLAGTNGVVYKGVLNYNGADTLTIFTSDGGNAGSGGTKTDTDTVSITVLAVNDAPTPLSTAISAQTAVKNLSTWQLDMSTYFSDADVGDSKIYSIVGGTLPAGLVLSQTTGLISGTPTGTAANAAFTVRMTDGGGLYAEKTFDLQVVDKPMIQSFTVSDSSATSPNTAQIGAGGEALTFVVTFNQMVDVSAGATITFTMNGQNVTGTCTAGVNSSLTASFTATVPTAGDGTAVGISALASGTIAAPAANGGQSLLTTNFNTLSYNGYRVDNTTPAVTSSYNVNENTSTDTTNHTVQLVAADNSAVTWSTTLGGADAAKFTLSASGLLSFVGNSNFEVKDDADANGVYDLTVTATDAVGKTTNQAVTINLQNVNEAPIISSTVIADQPVVASSTHASTSPIIDMSTYFTDPEGATLTYSLHAGAPAWLAITSDGKVYNTTAAPSTAAADLAVTVDVTDGTNMVSKSFNIDVVEAPKITNAAVLDGQSSVDVTSNFVFKFDQAVNAYTTSGAKYIRIKNDANGAGKDGYKGEQTAEDILIDVTDTNQVTVSGDGMTITVNPTAHLDISNNYHIEVDAGAFTARMGGLSSVGITDSTTINFSTVTPLDTASAITAVSAANLSKFMSADGSSLTDGTYWVDIEDRGTPNAFVNMDAGAAGASNKNYSFVFKDYDPTPVPGSPVAGDNGIGTDDFGLRLYNFGYGDLIYVDSKTTDSNRVDLTTFTGSGTDTLSGTGTKWKGIVTATSNLRGGTETTNGSGLGGEIRISLLPSTGETDGTPASDHTISVNYNTLRSELSSDTNYYNFIIG